MPDYKLYVVVEVAGKTRAARIAKRDYVNDRRCLAAASILAGQPVPASLCVRVEVSDGRLFTDVVGHDVPVDRRAVDHAVFYCRREISSAEVTARLRPAKPLTTGLFGALA